jgi:hypothetical protein
MGVHGQFSEILCYILGMIKIHASMLSGYFDCPRRAATRIIKSDIVSAGYVLNAPAVGIGAAVGRGCHTVAAHLARVKMSGEMPGAPDLSAGVEQGIIEYRDEIKGGVEYDGITAGNNEAERQIQIIGAAVLYDIMPLVNPVSVEPAELSARVNDMEFVGHWDVENPDGIDDYKTGAKLRPAHAQMGGYSLLRATHKKQRAEKLRVFYLPRVSPKKSFPGAQVIVYAPSVCEKAAVSTINHIQNDIKNYQKTGSPWAFPANPNSMICSKKYCTAYGTEWCGLTGGRK